ncbi:MAG TPA: HEPN domain-containing protein [Candidatus Wunengus sp. YC63]|uniref:HEPN domain-containing protein n=1 Tax=unclassified Candidatus Wunengus TaxID=3367695 RepID=UPI002713F685|nr:HEPN domain-containing protein [Candidatus Brocadiales bacterium]
MNEIKSLISRSERYMKSAGLLIKDGDYESAVSRVYYAMFYCVEAVLLTKGLSFSSHKAVISAFGEHFVKTGIFPKDMSKAITLAFEKRQFGDYEFTFVIAKEEAEEIIRQGHNFITAIIKYLKESGHAL